MTDSNPVPVVRGDGPSATEPQESQSPPRARSGKLRTWWNASAGAIGVITGLAPHVLHHVGLLAGTALVAGTGGTTIFGILGLLASVPLLLRLKRRFGSWWAPAIGLAVFAVMFAVSAFLIGPAISGNSGGPGGGQPTPTVNHSNHHG